MTLLAGTPDGVYQSPSERLDDVELVLDAGNTLRVRTFENHGSFAATRTGLYCTDDGGATWTDLGVPRTQVDSVVVSPDGSRLYAGSPPGHIYVSTDTGDTWSELAGFRKLPSREQWGTPRHGGAGHVRSLDVHPDKPERVVAGVEVGGVHVSNDNGVTWTERRDGLQTARSDSLQYDVHHILVVDADTYVVSCGGGLYRTRDAGRSWTRLDTGLDHPYFQAAVANEGRLYAAAQTLPPTLPMGRSYSERHVEAAMFESSDGGEVFEAVAYPGRPTEFVSAWSVANGGVLAGTTAGRVIIRENDAWVTRGRVPTWIRSLAVV